MRYVVSLVLTSYDDHYDTDISEEVATKIANNEDVLEDVVTAMEEEQKLLESSFPTMEFLNEGCSYSCYIKRTAEGSLVEKIIQQKNKEKEDYLKMKKEEELEEINRKLFKGIDKLLA